MLASFHISAGELTLDVGKRSSYPHCLLYQDCVTFVWPGKDSKHATKSKLKHLEQISAYCWRLERLPCINESVRLINKGILWTRVIKNCSNRLYILNGGDV